MDNDCLVVSKPSINCLFSMIKLLLLYFKENVFKGKKKKIHFTKSYLYFCSNYSVLLVFVMQFLYIFYERFTVL